MRVTDRDEDVFSVNRTDWDQLDDTIAIMNLGGKEMYFDPGDPFCEFGKLHWTHAWTAGVRQLDNHVTGIAPTPATTADDNQTRRDADLRMDANGQVQGTIRISMTGNVALRWRQQALLSDVEQVKKDFLSGLQADVPAGVTLKMQGFTGLTDYAVPLVATLQASGTPGTRTGRRLFLPASFFEAGVKARFATATRTNLVYLHYAYTIQDHVTLTLPPGSSAEIVPKDAALSFPTHAAFTANYRLSGNACQYDRLERVNSILYSLREYPDLRDFFQKMSAQDQAQLVLQITPALATPQ